MCQGRNAYFNERNHLSFKSSVLDKSSWVIWNEEEYGVFVIIFPVLFTLSIPPQRSVF
jgi:hypothetical protein